MERRGRLNGGMPTTKLVETLSANHCVFGAKLLEKWKYADSYIRCAADHQDPPTDSDEEVDEDLPMEIRVVRFANSAAKALGYNSSQESNDQAQDVADIAYTHKLKLNLISTTRLKEKLTAEMEGAMELF